MTEDQTPDATTRKLLRPHPFWRRPSNAFLVIAYFLVASPQIAQGSGHETAFVPWAFAFPPFGADIIHPLAWLWQLIFFAPVVIVAGFLLPILERPFPTPLVRYLLLSIILFFLVVLEAQAWYLIPQSIGVQLILGHT